MPTRTIYTTGRASIYWTKDRAGVWDTTHLAIGNVAQAVIPTSSLIIQSFDFSHDIPKETITSFGTSAFKRIANEAESAEVEMEIYPSVGIGGLNGKTHGISALAKSTMRTNPNYVNVHTTAGNVYWALMSSFEFEASVGDVPTMSLTFMGTSLSSVHTLPHYYSKLTTPATSLAALSNVGTTAVISAGLRGNVYGVGNGSTIVMNAVYPQSISFSWDGSVETVSRLGDAINVSTAYSSPPGEASMDCEGLADPGTVQWLAIFGSRLTGAAASAESLGTATIGGDPVQSDGTHASTGHSLTIAAFFLGYAGDLSSRSVSISVGELYGTFSTTTEGTAQGVTIW